MQSIFAHPVRQTRLIFPAYICPSRKPWVPCRVRFDPNVSPTPLPTLYYTSHIRRDQIVSIPFPPPVCTVAYISGWSNHVQPPHFMSFPCVHHVVSGSTNQHRDGPSSQDARLLPLHKRGHPGIVYTAAGSTPVTLMSASFSIA